MLAEISKQINEHGLNQQKTEVMSIDADLLDVETTEDWRLRVYVLVVTSDGGD